MIEKQRTLAGEAIFSGKGLHTGAKVTMKILPAAENHGIKFKRVDLEGSPVIDAAADAVVDTSRGTTIASKDVKLSTLEHLMAAFYCCEIDNAMVEVDAPEVPIMDGSAASFVAEFSKIGTIEQAADREYLELDEKVVYEEADRGVKIEIYPDDQFSATVNVDFNSKVIGRQYAAITTKEEIRENIAPCRTFVFLHEIMPLINANLIKGGDIDNAIVIVEKPLPEEEITKLRALFNNKDISVDKSGYLNNIELRGENEIARHKLLDLVGDLFLAGVHVKGKVFATRPGHKANTELAKVLKKIYKASKSKPRFKYDQNATPIYDINGIKKILPHRPPFLLVDKIAAIDSTSIVGVKNVTMNEPFFVGHFPDEPVMPGVLQVEAMAQCGGILALSTVEDPQNYSTYFAKIDEVKFKRKVVPGDTLLFILELAEPIRRGIVKMNASAYVGDTLACEAFLVAQIVRNRA